MACLAQGELGPDVLDRVARALRDVPQLAQVDWDWVVQRAEELSVESPLFFDARASLVERLTDPEDQRTALALAARWVGGGRELSEEPRAVLGALASAFGIPELEMEALLSPSGVTDSADLGFVRSSLNDPESTSDQTLFEALRLADDDVQRRLLLFKLTAARRLVWTLSHDPVPPQIVKVGEPLRIDALRFRVDVVIVHDGRRHLTRLVAAGEALHRREHRLLRVLADRLPETARVLVAHEGRLSPEDESFIRGLDPGRLHTVQLAPYPSAGSSAG